MAIKEQDTKAPISFAPVAINTGVKPAATQNSVAKNGVALKAPTDYRLKPEQDVAFQKMMGKISGSDEANRERDHWIFLETVRQNQEDLNAPLPKFDTLFDETVHIGEQKLESRAEVAKEVDRLSTLADIVHGKSQPSREYSLDYSGFPHKNYSGANATGHWNKLSSQPVKVDQNFSLNGSFQQAFQVVLASEGGFSNHKNDNGGATIYGIASRSNPNEYRMIMDQLARGDTTAAMQTTMMTYKSKYWDSIQGIENMSPSARLVAFDAAVNHGVGFANKMVKATGADTDAMLAYRAQKYAAIIQNDPSQTVFEKGWGNRLAKLDTLTDVSERNTLKLASAPRVNLPDRQPS